MPAAVLFDMDGTIVDPEPFWMGAETELVAQYGGTWTHEQGLAMVGLGLWDAAAVLQAAGVDLAADDIVSRLSSRVIEKFDEGLPWRPGARELLASVKEAGIPTALVTMSIRRMAEAVAAAIGFAGFDVIVPGDEVEYPKPHPAAYLRAAEVLGVDITACVAVEDSVPGLASAVASGAATIVVPLQTTIEPNAAFTLWTSLEGRTVDDLRHVLSARVTAVETARVNAVETARVTA